MRPLAPAAGKPTLPGLLRPRSWWLVPIATASLAVAFVLSQDDYLAFVATSWVISGITALSLALVWGRAGILSLGQTAFFGLGGYAGAIAVINFSDVIPNTLIWALPVGAAVGALAALGMGWLMFYARMGPLQQTILTYTSTLLLWTLSVSFTHDFGDAVVGGQNGMSNIPSFVFGLSDDAGGVESKTMFVTVVVAATILLLATQALMRSPFGVITDCIRLDEEKAGLIGFDARRFKIQLFVLSGALAGLAGGMFVLWANFINPSVFGVQEALLIPIYVLVGGLGTLGGAFVGAVAVGGLAFWLGGGAGGDQTTIILGAALILLVRFYRAGLVGAVSSLVKKVTRRGADPLLDAATPIPRGLDFLRLGRLGDGVQLRPEISLQGSGLSRSFGGVIAVDSVTQVFTTGRVRCIIGPNGAGKSSFLKLLIGAYRPDMGTVSVNGSDLTGTDPHDRVKHGLGIKMQRAQVFGELDVRTNLWVAAYSKTRDSAVAAELADRMLSMLRLLPRADRQAADLSHGEQQWLDIGMVLCLAPDVILLDEPAAGMTLQERQLLSELVRALSKSAAVVVVDHDMSFIRSLDAEVTVMHQGRVFAQGDIEQIRKDERVLDIYLGRQ